MKIDRPTIVRLVGAVILAVIFFVMVITDSYPLPVLLLVPVCTILLAGYHAYDGGSPRITILILLIVASGMMIGVRVSVLSRCGTGPCYYTYTRIQTYLEWTLFATILGIVVYLVGFIARDRLPLS